MIVNDGLNLMRDLVHGTGTSPTHMAVGSDSTVTTITDTTLGGELSREAFSASSTSDKKITYEMFLSNAEANGGSLCEVGVFNASSNGTMLGRNIFNVIGKTNKIDVQMEYSVLFTRG